MTTLYVDMDNIPPDKKEGASDPDKPVPAEL